MRRPNYIASNHKIYYKDWFDSYELYMISSFPSSITPIIFDFADSTGNNYIDIDYIVNFSSGVSNTKRYFRLDDVSISYDHFQTFNHMKADSSGYRFGFNGQEKDNELYGEGNAYSFEYRIHDPRVGRFLSVDPLANCFPWNSSYSFAENKVIQFSELEGLEVKQATTTLYNSGGAVLIPAIDQTGYATTPPEFQKALNDYKTWLNTLVNSKYPMVTNAVAQQFQNLPQTEMTDNGANSSIEAKTTIMLQGFVIRYGVPGADVAIRKLNGEEVKPWEYGIEIIGVIPIGKTLKAGGMLFKLSDKALVSEAGLVYKLYKGGNRFDHVLEHMKNDPLEKLHGIWKGTENDALTYMDEAWSKVNSKSSDVLSITKGNDGSTSYIIDMKKQVGTQGGNLGKGETLNKIKIVVKNGNEVVSGFPVQ